MEVILGPVVIGILIGMAIMRALEYYNEDKND